MQMSKCGKYSRSQALLNRRSKRSWVAVGLFEHSFRAGISARYKDFSVYDLLCRLLRPADRQKAADEMAESNLLYDTDVHRRHR